MASTTNPEDWFLENVIFSNGNKVTPLIDGQAYYNALLSIFTSNSTFLNVLISGWRLNKDTVIENSGDITFEDLLKTHLNTKENFSVLKSMLWYVPGSIGDFGSNHGQENSAFTDFIVDNGGQAILDNRLPKGRFASHHQKYIIVDGAENKAAFIGGIDIAPDRLDSSSHDNSIIRMEENFKAWHDVQIKVEGPCVSESMKLFQERWNDPRPANDIPFVAGSSTTTALSVIPEITDIIGTHSVQFLKTYPCKSNDSAGSQSSYPFAPNGAYTYQEALIRAIKNAEYYVYIEDQYCWPSDVVNELASAATRGVAVILVLARDFDSPGVAPYHNYLRNQAIELIRKSQGDQELLFVYHLEQNTFDPQSQQNFELFVHSKVMIIDDRYMVVGSGNLNRRSMKTDTELGVAVVDQNTVISAIKGKEESVSVLARNFRKSLFSEHLGVPSTDDPFDSEGRPASFPTQNDLVGHVRRHVVATPRFCNPSIIPFALFNSNVTC